MNRGHLVIGLVLATASIALLLLLVLYGGGGERHVTALSSETALYVTDFALFTEAPHTRHPRLSDLRTAYREGPGALEHSVSSLFLPHPREQQ